MLPVDSWACVCKVKHHLHINITTRTLLLFETRETTKKIVISAQFHEALLLQQLTSSCSVT